MWFRDPCLLSTILTVHIASAVGQVQYECPADMDIITLLDGSTSMGDSDFEQQTSLVIDMVKHLNLAPDGPRFAALVYSSIPREFIEFSTDTENLVAQISSLDFPGGMSRTHRGINKMNSLFETNSHEEHQKIGIVITDSLSNSPEETHSAALESKDAGITMFAVGVGDTVDMEELRGIASSESHVLRASDFDTLDLLSVLEVICIVSSTATKVLTTTPASTTTTPSNLETINNCPKQHRPGSEILSFTFVRVAKDTTLSPTNPGLVEIHSVDTESCAIKCASLQTCVIYSFSDTGVCRVTDNCQPTVEIEPDTQVLALSYWG